MAGGKPCRASTRAGRGRGGTKPPASKRGNSGGCRLASSQSPGGVTPTPAGRNSSDQALGAPSSGRRAVRRGSRRSKGTTCGLGKTAAWAGPFNNNWIPWRSSWANACRRRRHSRWRSPRTRAITTRGLEGSTTWPAREASSSRSQPSVAWRAKSGLSRSTSTQGLKLQGKASGGWSAPPKRRLTEPADAVSRLRRGPWPKGAHA